MKEINMKKINMKKIIGILRKHPYISQVVICICVGILAGTIFGVYGVVRELAAFNKYNNGVLELISIFFTSIVWVTFICTVIGYPIVVSIYELIYLISTIAIGREHKSRIVSFIILLTVNIKSRTAAIYDLFVLYLGLLLEWILLFMVHNIIPDAQWYEQLRNYELHAPINGESCPTFWVLSLMFTVGMLVLMLIPSNKRAPLITVSSIAAMYIGVIEAILFAIQLIGMNYVNPDGIKKYDYTPDLLFTFLIPFNMILILIRVMVIEIRSFEITENRMSKINSIPFLSWCNNMLSNSRNWPVIALVIMIPLLVCIIVILVLFGQAPDDAIKAFTETANYTFSTKIPPQNVFYDEHYLCTVAAGGHRRIVKPIRMGKRHGHDVVVNRQLLIANAFEQVLEEKTPMFHRRLRNFYDKYGFPVSKLIKSKTIADIIWVIMKPLEWIFLIVIYLVDTNPEDRISSQYL